jgi:hypothetical protein
VAVRGFSASMSAPSGTGAVRLLVPDAKPERTQGLERDVATAWQPSSKTAGSSWRFAVIIVAARR